MSTGTRLGRRPQLSEEVADHVRTSIMSGQLLPGDFVRLDETALSLGVSVTPVREALLTLRGEGLVDLVPRRGYVVSPMSPTDIEDIFWVQATLSKRIAARTIDRLTPEFLRAHEALVEDFEAAVEAKDIDWVVSAEYKLNRSINLASGSDKLARFLALAGRYMPYRIYAADPDWREANLTFNKEMLEVLRNRDIDSAYEIIDRVLRDGANRLIEHLTAAGVWPDRVDGGATNGQGEK